jgi:hypothetical protein
MRNPFKIQSINMKKLFFVALSLAISPAIKAQTYTPISLTGFTADIIANGAGPALSSTTQDVDGGGYNFMSQDYVSPANQTPTTFLPGNGTINSAATSGLNFQLAPYTGNNSLRITNASGPGTLTFTTPRTADQIYVLVTTAYPSTFTATVNFSDGTTQAFSGNAVPNWFDGTIPIAIKGIGRVQRSVDGIQNSTTNPRLYQFLFTLNAANAGKTIQSITFDKTTSAANEILHIMGITTGSLLATDAGIAAISAPNAGCILSNQETITVSVKNYGSTPLSNIPVSYKIDNGGFINEMLAGPLAPNTSVNYSFTTKADLSAAGTYILEAKTILPGDLGAINDVQTRTIILSNVPAVPAITSNGPTTFCTSGGVTLTATSATPGVKYQWFNNGTAIANAINASLIVNAAGTYTAVSTTNGCASGTSAATTVVVNPLPTAPNLFNSGSTNLCAGDSVILTAATSITGATFTWFKNSNVIPGANSATYKAKVAGDYSAAVTANGCTSSTSPIKSVTVKQRPGQPTITQSGFVLTSSSNTGNQWYQNGVAISGATNPTLSVTSNGTYTVDVTTNGCPSVVSNAISILNTGIKDDLKKVAVNVYPNPSTGIFNITFPESQTYQLIITDLTGKITRQATVKNNKAELDLSHAAKGIYLLKIVSEGKNATQKLIVE